MIYPNMLLNYENNEHIFESKEALLFRYFVNSLCVNLTAQILMFFSIRLRLQIKGNCHPKDKFFDVSG
jgi:hypothetical protein